MQHFQYPFSQQKYLVSFAIGRARDIFIDYVIVDQNGRSPHGSNYLRDMRWRSELHAKHHTNYIVLPSWRWCDCSMFDFLKTQLNARHVTPQRLSNSWIYENIIKDEKHFKNLDGFYRMVQTFLLLHKNGMYDLPNIKKRLSSGDKYNNTRNGIFYGLYEYIYEAYERLLFKTCRYDFADMINSARRQVEEVEDCARGYEYILLDEVQDLSRNRLLLVRSILRKNPGCKLFAVGDDWQSIYRFAGSDLTLIRNFEHVFGLTTRRSFIESTHRFGQPTIRISCNFIQRNPIQSYKKVKGTKKTSTPIYVIYNKQTRQKEGQDAESLQLILRNIVERIGFEAIKQKTIQIISRFNQDILRIKSEHFAVSPRGDSNSIFDIV